ncbi:MAG: hypothetical protein HOW73_26440 [Polyangiaceae bacterium]|nr:hypothetical protein [Polyangiaceae bacterium]
MLDLTYDYESCVKASERISWKVDDVLPVNAKLDFTRPFLPDQLAGTRGLATLGGAPFLDDHARLRLNQIGGNAYLNLFGFVEEYILATMMKHAQAEVFGDPMNLRALLRFTDEELKHQALFNRYRDAFERDFQHRCGVLKNAVEVAGVIMSHSPAAVLLITLHIELMTQQHYVECVKDAPMDPLFQSLLKHHWLEESQHARIDALELDKIARTLSSEKRDLAVDEYLGILDAFDGLLAEQAKLDIESLSTVLGRTFNEAEADAIRASQLAAYRKTFIWYGMTNPTFVSTTKKLSPSKAVTVAERALKFASSERPSQIPTARA